MMTTGTFQYRPYAMEYGTFVGLCWGAAFFTYAEGIAHDNGLLVLLCMMLLGMGAVMPFVLAFRLNRKAALAGTQLRYWQGLLFALSMFAYASLLSGTLAFAYFEWMDEGQLVEKIIAMAGQPEMVDLYGQMGMGEQYGQMMTLLNQMEALSSLEKALMVFNNNFFTGFLLSFVVAVVASLKPSIKH